MKTSSVSQQAPAAKTTDNKTPNKTEAKPQKEFKEVLDSDAPKVPRGKIYGKGLQKGPKLAKGQTEHQPLTHAGKKPVSAKHGKEDFQEGALKKEEFSKKQVKEKEELKEFSVPNMNMSPASIQAKAEVQKTHAPALNIREIESIVQKVQVGVNEKGLPEMNFEIMTDKLGALNLKVSSENEKINIQFVTQDASAQAELQKGMNELSQLLGQRGLNLAETNVMTRDQQSQQQQDRGGRESDSSVQTETAKTRARKRSTTVPDDDGFTI
ncbi:flagellar hook-length control protein FliK [bacterium]|nr:flagellar hook-length control protein FliK [bacterium]MCI0606942.1 flagellar hook-length control protein FliK [bacterium]